MKKICFILPSLKAGGQERVMAEIANYAVKTNDHEYYLILFTKGDHFYDIDPKIKIIEPDWVFSNKTRFIDTIKTLLFIRQSVKIINPYSILSFGEGWNSFVLLALLGIKTNKYVSDRCNPILKLPLIQRITYYLLYPKTKGIIAQTEIAKHFIYKKTKHKRIEVIGNPIRNISCNNILKKENIILNVGRFVPTKHQLQLIKLFIDINNKEWTLILLGDGICMNECKKYTEDNGWGENIIFKGSVKDIDRYYATSKIFAFMSSSEGFPNVLLEAMSASLACISYNFQMSASEFIENKKNGILVPLYDTVQYKKELLTLMNNKDLIENLGTKGQVVAKKFNTKSIASKFINFITE